MSEPGPTTPPGGWTTVYTKLQAAYRARGLTPAELERLAETAYLLGHDDEAITAWTRAHAEWVARGEMLRAARTAFWVGWSLFYTGRLAQANGWFGRARQHADRRGPESAEQGLLLLPAALRRRNEGDLAGALRTFEMTGQLAEEFDDEDLRAFSLLGQGQCLARKGDVEAGMGLLDQAMVVVTGGGTNPLTAGTVYCAVLEECQRVFDLSRALEWTEALQRWCADPDMVPYRGQCMIHRSEIMMLHGQWSRAVEEIEAALVLLAGPPAQPGLGIAHYQLAELNRLRGRFENAEESYGNANLHGVSPQPGLAQLRLAQGRGEAADAAVRRLKDELSDRLERCRMLGACTEILLYGNRPDEARVLADELAATAVQINAPLLQAAAAHANGLVLMAEGSTQLASEELKRSQRLWQGLEVPYEVARIRVGVARVMIKRGDIETAELEFDAARWIFEQLGAQPDLRNLESLTRRSKAKTLSGLTARELQVLGLVSAGKTNREVAEALFVSDHTIRRHLQNIFAKLGVSTRAAAAAFAVQHHLIDSPIP